MTKNNLSVQAQLSLGAKHHQIYLAPSVRSDATAAWRTAIQNVSSSEVCVSLILRFGATL